MQVATRAAKISFLLKKVLILSPSLSFKGQFENCNIRPTYNYTDQKIGIFCVAHKKENMIDIKHKRYQYKNCNTRSIFSFIGQKIGIFYVMVVDFNMEVPRVFPMVEVVVAIIVLV